MDILSLYIYPARRREASRRAGVKQSGEEKKREREHFMLSYMSKEIELGCIEV